MLMGEIEFLDWASTDLRKSVFGVVSVDGEKCTGCAWCALACPSSSLEVVEQRAQMRVVSPNECSACGDCQAICPKGAIAVAKSCQWPGYYLLVERGELAKPRLRW